MVYFVAIWLLFLGICLCIGIAILQGLAIWDCLRQGDRFILAEWIGLLVLAITSLTVGLLLPLTIGVSVGLVLTLLILSVISGQVRYSLRQIWHESSLLSKGGVLAGIWAIALFMTQAVTWIDTGLYHVGIIRWLVNYGTVPGVALIHDRLGFTSSWFSLAALVNPEVTSMQAIAIPNGFLAILTFTHFGISLRYSFSRQSRLADWFLTVAYGLLIPLFLGSTLFTELLVSPSPDIPIVLLTLLSSWMLLVIRDLDQAQPLRSQVSRNLNLVLLFLAISAIAIKLTAIPLLLLISCFYCWQVGFKGKDLWIGSILLIGLLIPVVLYGQITAGCAFYPATTFCTDVPWTLIDQFETQILTPTVGWRSWFTDVPSDVLFLPWALQIWWQQSLMNKIMAVLMILSVCLFVYAVWRWKTKLLNSIAIVPILGLFGSLFIMALSPGIRFGLGYLLLIPTWLIAELLRAFSRTHWTLVSSSRAVNQAYQNTFVRFSPGTVLLFFAALGVTISCFNPNIQSRLLWPLPLPRVTVVSAQVNDVQYVYSADFLINSLCWNAEIPCSLGPLEVDIQLRRPEDGLAGGFEYAR